jgi:hypothetical protein
VKRKFQVGDIVVDQHGKIGTVIARKGNIEYPISVEFFTGRVRHINTYTPDGVQYLNEEEFWIRHLTKLEKAMK